MSEYQLPPHFSCGFIEIEFADKLPLCEVVYSRNSGSHISLTFWGKTSGQAGAVSLLSIQMRCLPEERAEF